MSGTAGKAWPGQRTVGSRIEVEDTRTLRMTRRRSPHPPVLHGRQAAPAPVIEDQPPRSPHRSTREVVEDVQKDLAADALDQRCLFRGGHTNRPWATFLHRVTSGSLLTGIAVSSLRSLKSTDPSVCARRANPGPLCYTKSRRRRSVQRAAPPAAGVLTAIDVQDLAGHEIRPLEIQHGVDDIADLAHAVDGMQARKRGMRFPDSSESS